MTTKLLRGSGGVELVLKFIIIRSARSRRGFLFAAAVADTEFEKPSRERLFPFARRLAVFVSKREREREREREGERETSWKLLVHGREGSGSRSIAFEIIK